MAKSTIAPQGTSKICPLSPHKSSCTSSCALYVSGASYPHKCALSTREVKVSQNIPAPVVNIDTVGLRESIDNLTLQVMEIQEHLMPPIKVSAETHTEPKGLSATELEKLRVKEEKEAIAEWINLIDWTVLIKAKTSEVAKQYLTWAKNHNKKKPSANKTISDVVTAITKLRISSPTGSSGSMNYYEVTPEFSALYVERMNAKKGN